MKIDQKVLDQIETELTKRVEENVRRRLFRYYITTGTIIAAALGFFGYDTVSSLRDFAAEEAQDAVKGAAQQARESANKATEVAISAEAQIKALDAHLERRETVLITSEQETRQNTREVRAMREEVEQGLIGIEGSLDGVQIQIEKAQREALAQFEALRERSVEQAGLGNLNNLADALETLTLQVQTLGTQVDALQGQIETGTPSHAAGLDFTEVDQVLDTVRLEQTTLDVGNSAPKPTVYFQFAGVNRSVAQQISFELGAFGYAMPGEERVGGAAGKREVRYFFEEDRAAAEQLATELGQVLERLHYQSEVQVVDFAGYKSTKPRLGTVELWLEPIPE